MSKRYPGLSKIRETWYFRKRVPEDIIDYFDKKIIQVSLGTPDREEAYENYRLVRNDYENRFSEARRQKQDNKPILISELQATEFAKIWFRQARMSSEHMVRQKLSDESQQDHLIELGEWYQIFSSDEDETIQPHLQFEADKFLMTQGYPTQIEEETGQKELTDNFDKTTKGYLNFLELVRRGQLELIRQQAAITNGEDPGDIFFSETAPQPTVVATSRDIELVNSPNATTQSTQLKSLIDEYLVAANRDEQNREQSDRVAAFRVLTGVVGESIVLEGLTYRKFSDVFSVLKNLPPNFSKMKSLRNKPLKTVADETKKSGGSTLSARSVNKYMRHISAMMQWAVNTGLTNSNYSNNRYLRVATKASENGKNARNPFPIETLNSLLRTKIYASPDPDKPSEYWVPLIALFHGMRLEEILQLTAQDIQQEGKIKYFHLHSNGENSLKNTNAHRNVPIHPKIWELGFRTLIKSASKRSKQRLFFDTELGPSERFGKEYSKRFTRYLLKNKLKNEKISFHSFRHNFSDAGRNRNIPENRISQIAGWATETGARSNYGSGINLTELNKAIEQVEYEGLDLSSIVVIDWKE